MAARTRRKVGAQSPQDGFFWSRRDEGLNACVRFCIDTFYFHVSIITWVCGVSGHAGHITLVTRTKKVNDWNNADGQLVKRRQALCCAYTIIMQPLNTSLGKIHQRPEV